MTTDNRTAGEKARDGAGGDKPPIIERVSLRDALARKRQLEQAGNGVSVPDPERFREQVPTVTLGNGVPAELLTAAGGVGASPVRVGNGAYNHLPVASPLTLIDQARNIQESLDGFARSLTGAAEWCEARARELPPLEAHALLFTAKMLRADGGRCGGIPAPFVGEGGSTGGTTAPEADAHPPHTGG